jgi:hypothetical protein
VGSTATVEVRRTLRTKEQQAMDTTTTSCRRVRATARLSVIAGGIASGAIFVGMAFAIDQVGFLL